MVRERLCELEIPYLLRSAGRTRIADWVPPFLRDTLNLDQEPDQHNRINLLQRAGRVSIPYLADPNTGEEMGESQDIIRYLDATYAGE